MYRIFGITLASDYPFRNRLAAGTPPADVTFGRVGAAPVELEGAEPRQVSPYRTREGESLLELYHLESVDVLRFAGLVDFYLAAGRIDCWLRDPSREFLVEIYLLGSTLSFWLERQGLPALHGSAVDVGGRAVGFLSSNHGGKSSLAAALMSRGHPLLTDDVLPVEARDGPGGEVRFLARPGYPQMRMWPAEADHFLGRWQDLEVVHPANSKRRVPVGEGGLGRFCRCSRPLSHLYLPRRRPPDDDNLEIEIEPLSRRDAVIELIRHSFSPLLVEAIGWQARRLDFFARLVERVPVRRLLYPSGLDRLPAVCDHILKDRERS